MNCDFAPTGEIHKKSGREILRCRRPGCSVFGLMPPSGDPKNLVNASGCKSVDPCAHFGSEVRWQPCDACKGNIRIKVFACAVHQETTLSKKLDGLACCAGCKDYAPTPPENPS
jgi:hypothetical protein